MSYKSKYKPINPQKYIGNLNQIICRSNWERKVCKFLDINENVVSWSSEELSIPYYSPIDKKWHKYFPDFVCSIKNKNNKTQNYVIEVKPKKQTLEPKISKNKKKYLNEMKTFTINTCKWKAANDFCEKNGWKFKILTEKEIF